MLHQSKKLLLMHGLLLPLDGLLLSLEVVLPSLKLCEHSSGLLSQACLVLPHLLKYSKESGVCLWGRWR